MGPVDDGDVKTAISVMAISSEVMGLQKGAKLLHSSKFKRLKFLFREAYEDSMRIQHI